MSFSARMASGGEGLLAQLGSPTNPNSMVIDSRAILTQLRSLSLESAVEEALRGAALAPSTSTALESLLGGLPLDPIRQLVAAVQQVKSVRATDTQSVQYRHGAHPPAHRRKEQVRRTVYITDVDPAVTEAQLAAFFQDCGHIVDCRVCGDHNSVMRFAFVEFHSEDGSSRALHRSGCMLGSHPIRVAPSKTAIVPVNNQYLPRSEQERQAVERTVYVANIHRVVERSALNTFFENLCGPIAKIRVLGDAAHSTKIAFVEFVSVESAQLALECSGALLGTLPIRVSPSKTPVRTESRRIKAYLGGTKQAAALGAGNYTGGLSNTAAGATNQAATENFSHLYGLSSHLA